MKAEGVEHIYLLGHSTGGLTASLYMSSNPDSAIRALILNSPFLAWNLSGLKRAMIPLISAIGRYFPNMTVPQPKDTRYAASLRRELGGEWDYRTQWKPDQMPDVDAGWVRAIEQAQRRLQRGAGIAVPVLLMTSARSAKASDDMAVFRCADGVLDVGKIRRAALALGPSIAMEEIEGGLHDLALSPPPVRKRYYSLIEKFLRAVGT